MCVKTMTHHSPSPTKARLDLKYRLSDEYDILDVALRQEKIADKVDHLDEKVTKILKILTNKSL